MVNNDTLLHSRILKIIFIFDYIPKIQKNLIFISTGSFKAQKGIGPGDCEVLES